MPTFQYTAMDGKGKEQKGRVEAGNQQEAAAKLKQMGLFATNIATARTGSPARGGSRGQGKATAKKSSKKGGMLLTPPSIKRKKLTVFTRQLATLLEAGQALVRGLRTLERQAGRDPAVSRVIGDLADAVEGGSTFSEALAGHPRTFSKLYVSMVRAGEAAGQLEGTLNNLAVFMEKAERIRGKVKSALAYPIAILVVATIITIFLMVYIVPKFEEIFNDMLEGAELPTLTKFVVGASVIIKDRFLWVFAGLVVFIVVMKMLKKTKQGALAWDMMLIKMPPFNTLVIRSTVARVCRTLGTLMDSGVSVLQALQIARETSGNAVVGRAMQDVHDAVKEGEGMSRPLQNSGVFPPIVISMVEVGEETGALPNMLTRISDVYEEEVDRAVEGLTAILEPMTIVLLAVVVGTIVIAMFLPLIKLIENLGGPAG